MQEQSGTASKLARIWVKGNIMPIGTDKVVMMSAAAGGAGANWFGDGTDGAFSSSGDTAITPANEVGDWDADMVVKNYTSFTLNDGHDYYIDHPCRGVLIYVTGDCYIGGIPGYYNNSGADYPRHGGEANPESAGGSDSAAVSSTGIRLPMFTASGTDTLAAADFAGCGTAAVAAVANQPGIAGNGTIYGVVRKGALGHAGGSGEPGAAPAGVISGGMGQTGGGGGGGGGGGSGGAGSYGHCWGAGSAGGGGSCGNGADATIWGGAGGSGGGTCAKIGGGGNPGGGPAGQVPCYSAGASVESFAVGAAGATGGTMFLIVGGNVEIDSNTDAGEQAGIYQRGHNGGEIRTYYPGCNVSASNKATGGGTGGGAIFILHKGTLTNNGTVSANGGGGGHPSNLSPKTWGGTGGAGTIITAQVS